jgi:small subunit ribosomal protein S5
VGGHQVPKSSNWAPTRRADKAANHLIPPGAMSISRPAARCLFQGPSHISKLCPRVRRQNFHASAPLPERRRSRFASIKAAELQAPAKEIFPAYSAEEKAALSKIYTPEQIAAIEAGEQAIDPEDLKSHGMLRTDLGRLDYIDDLSTTQPVIDKKLMDYKIDPNWTLDQDKVGEKFIAYLDKVMEEHPEEIDPEDPMYGEKHRPNRLDTLKAMQAELGDPSTYALAPAIPANFSKDPTTGMGAVEGKDDEEQNHPLDPDGIYNRFRKQTGLSMEDIMDLKVKILVNHRVVNQTRLGKIDSIYCLAVAGNGNGRLGIGEAKGQESEDTMNNAKIAAMRNMQPIPRYEDRTIFGTVEGKVSAVEVQLMSRPPGKSFYFPYCVSFCKVHAVANLYKLRIRPPLPTSHIRNVSLSRHPRHRGQSAALPK